MDKIRLYAKSIITLIINILIIVCTTSAQSTVSQQSENLLFSQALELYNQNLFGAALLKFEKVENQTTISPLAKSDAEYYSAICAIELHQKDAALRITNYMQKYPDSPHTKFLYFMMGKFNYREGNYDEALQWFEQTDFTTLTDEQAAEFYFKSGYAYFTMSNFIDATKAFNEVKDSQTDYAAPATYYLAHIAYSNNLYEPALQSFERLKNDERFAPLIPYYITHIYYLQKKFDKVVQYAPPLLDSANAEQAPEIARLIGDSYTKLQRYNEAVPFLERYKKTAKSHSRSAIYNLAYAYYTQKKYDIAASTFEEVITSDDSLAHNTYYLLGDCYLKLDKKDKARMAFFACSYFFSFNKA